MAESQEKHGRELLWLDPRTKLIVLAAYSVVVMFDVVSGPAAAVRTVMTILPVALLFLAGKPATGIRFIVLYIVAYLLLRVNSGLVGGIGGMLILAYASIVMQFAPTMIAVWYCIGTTKISEFMAAANRMHLPQGLSISLAVMMRFFPTIREEYRSIRDAMRMRGIALGGGSIAKMVEFRLVPLLFSCVSIGDELSAAAVTRGLGAPVARTNVCKIGFHAIDIVVIAFTLTTTVIYIYLVSNVGGGVA